MIKLPFLSNQDDEQKDEQTSPEVKKVKKGTTSVKDVIAPESIEVDFSDIKINDTYYRTLFVAGYPRFVNANWLAPLINFNHSLSISMFIYPIEGKGVVQDLKRKIAEMEAEIQGDVQRGRVVNIDTQVKLEDARQLQEQLAKGAERFFQFGLYVTIKEDNKEKLDQITKQVKSTLGSLLIVAKTATLQIENAFKTALPTASDHMKINRNMDTTSLATTFPFTSSELSANEGIMYGINEHNDSLVVFDRFSLENANMAIFAKSGAGKCLKYGEKTLIKENGKIREIKIGKYIDSLINKQKSHKTKNNTTYTNPKNTQVFTYNNQLQGEWADVEVAAKKTLKDRNILKLTTYSGREISVSGDHQVLTLKNGAITTKKASSIKKNDPTPIPRKISEPTNTINQINLINLFSNDQKIYVDGLKNIISSNKKTLEKNLDNPYIYKYARGRKVSLSLTNKILSVLNLSWSKVTKNNHIRLSPKNSSISLPDKIHITNNFSWLLGIYIAEGLINNNNIVISNQNKKITKQIKNAAEKLNINYTDTESGVNLNSKILTKLLGKLGLGSGAANKSMPNISWQLSNKKLAKTLQGYFDGDGTVNKHSVSATSKSKNLIQDITQQLLRYGIVARIRKKRNKKYKTSYWRVSISGADNLQRFSNHINFSHNKKKQKLASLVNRLNSITPNTNVDTAPNLSKTFQKLYKYLYKNTKSPGQNFIAIKNGVFNPSRDELKIHIKKAENRIKELEKTQKSIKKLNSLPKLEDLIKRGREKKNNTLLWKNLGQTWKVIKNEEVKPHIRTVLKIHHTLSGFQYSQEEILGWTHECFDELECTYKDHNTNISPCSTSKNNNTRYEYITKAAKYLTKRYQDKLSQIQKAKKLLQNLKKIANSNLYWDPIVSIEKIPYQHKHVYDLQVKNQVFMAGRGGIYTHNSYMIKLELLRSILFGTDIIVIDPEDEYKKLCDALGGTYIDFSLDADAKINPFDLPQLEEPDPNQLAHKIISLHSLMKVIMGELSPHEEAILDRALIATYRMKGITRNPETYSNEPPLMEDLYKVLIGMEEDTARSLADRIERFIKGSFRGVFDEHSNVDFGDQLTVFGIKNISDELRPIAIFIILDYIWTKIKNKLKKRMLIVDEAWYLMQHPDSASFLYSIAKRARKYYLGLTTITQDVEDFLNTKHGKAIVTNSSLQVLMKQSSAAIDQVADTFYLSQGERHLLLSAEIGEGLFFAGQNHVAIKVVASPEEHKLITTDPQEIVSQAKKPTPKKDSQPPKPQPKENTPDSPKTNMPKSTAQNSSN